MDGEKQPVRRSAGERRWVRLIVAAALVPIVLIGAIAGFWFWKGRQIEAELARIRAAGEPVTPADLDDLYQVPPDEIDVTDLWLDALESIDEWDNDEVVALPFVGDGEDPPPPGEPWGQLEGAEEFLGRHAESLRLLHEAARSEGAVRYPFNFNVGYVPFVQPQTQQLRAAVRLLQLQAHVEADRGDGKGVVQSIRAILATARTMEHEPLLLSFLARLALEDIAHAQIQHLLPHVEFEEEDVTQLQADLQAAHLKKGLRLAMLGGRVNGIVTFRDPSTIGATGADWVVWRLWARRDFRSFLEIMGQVVEASELDWPQAIQEINELDEDGGSDPSTPAHWVSISALALAGKIPAGARGTSVASFHAAARVTANNRMADAAIAVELFRRRHGRLPDGLEQLVPDLLLEVPRDPFVNAPIQYRVEEDGYLLYSVGYDGIDDGGKEQERSRGHPDLVFRVRKDSDE